MNLRVPIGIVLIATACGGGSQDVPLSPAAPANPAAPVVAQLRVGDIPELVLVDSPVRLTATASAPDHSPIPGATISWTSRRPSVVTVANDGTATGHAAGSTWIVATAGSASDSAQIFVALDAPASLRDAGAAVESATVHTAMNDQQVQVLDRENRPVPGVMVTFVDSAPGAVVTPASIRSDSLGIAHLAGWTMGTVAGEERLHASVAGGISITIVHTAVAAAAARAVISQGDAQDVTYGQSADSIEVRVTDTYGNPVANAFVAFSAAVRQGFFAPAEMRTNASGVARASWTMPSQLGSVSGKVAVENLAPLLVSATVVGFRAKMIAAGDAYTCAIDLADAAWCWGTNAWKQLGVEQPAVTNRPQRVLGGLRFAAISAIERLTCGLTLDQRVYCWGAGPLGKPSISVSAAPQLVSGDELYTSISSGDNVACGVTVTHQARCWGVNDYGELGNDTLKASYAAVPLPVSLANVQSIVTAGSADGTCAIVLDGSAYCWGSGSDFSLRGLGVSAPRTLVPGGYKFATVYPGYVRNCGITSDGRTSLCWDWIPDSMFVSRPPLTLGKPTEVIVAAGATVSAFSGSCALTTDGQVYCTGSLGYKSFSNPSTPAYVSVLGPGLHAAALASRFNSACVIADHKQVYCWGDGSAGATARANYVSDFVPTVVLP